MVAVLERDGEGLQRAGRAPRRSAAGRAPVVVGVGQGREQQAVRACVDHGAVDGPGTGDHTVSDRDRDVPGDRAASWNYAVDLPPRSPWPHLDLESDSPARRPSYFATTDRRSRANHAA